MGFFGGWSQVPGLQGYLNTIGQDQHDKYGGFVGMPGYNQIKQVDRGKKDLYSTQIGQGLVQDNARDLAARNQEADNDINSRYSMIGNDAFRNAMVTDQKNTNTNNSMNALASQRTGLLNTFMNIGQQQSAARTGYNQYAANFDAQRDEELARLKTGGNQRTGGWAQFLGGLGNSAASAAGAYFTGGATAAV